MPKEMRSTKESQGQASQESRKGQEASQEGCQGKEEVIAIMSPSLFE